MQFRPNSHAPAAALHEKWRISHSNPVRRRVSHSLHVFTTPPMHGEFLTHCMCSPHHRCMLHVYEYVGIPTMHAIRSYGIVSVVMYRRTLDHSRTSAYGIVSVVLYEYSTGSTLSTTLPVVLSILVLVWYRSVVLYR